MNMSNKRIVKGLLLASLLGACLWMTGCYIPPDQISDDTQNMTVGSGDNNFFTLAPTATATPTAAPNVSVTQSTGIDTGDTGSSTQATVNWDVWDTTADPGATTAPTTGTSTGGISVVTTAPTSTPKATSTPAPTSSSLRNGSTGTAVSQLQTRLKALGYYTGSIDGKYGTGTEQAVTAFQQANGLTADGVAGTRTISKLYSDNAVPASSSSSGGGSSGTTATATPKATAKVTNTPKPTATPNLTNARYLTIGSSGTDVKTLQNRLISLGWMGGEADGKYQGATEYAIMAFQKKTSGLWSDGIAGPDTQTALYASGAAKASTPSSSIGVTLESGSEGGSVRALQTRLKSLGYLSGSVDGSFGTATLTAVVSFQTNNGLNADGKAGTSTLNKLYSQDAVSASGSSSSGSSSSDSSSSGSSSSTSDSTISSTGYVTLREGDKSDAVSKLQQRLKDLGYYSGTVDGSYGSGTTAAVKAYQSANNLKADGIAGPATQRVLYGTSSTSSYSTLRLYDEGSAVTNLQYTLYELGYYDGKVDGVYGSTTSDAVRAFQQANGLTADGVAGNATLKKVYSSSAVSATAPNTTYTTLRYGDRGDEVVQLQDALASLGYMTVSATGTYDDLTTAAVRTFQTYNGLNADGVAGSETQAKLYGNNPVRYPY